MAGAPALPTSFQDVSSATSETNALHFVFSQLMAKTWSACPVSVVAVKKGGGGAVAAAGSVDVHPLVNQVDGSGVATPHGTIFGLPYIRLQGGANGIIIDPAVGDIGLAVFCDRDISSVKANKAQANPGSWRRYNPSDGIYIGGILNAVVSQYLQFAGGITAGTPVLTTTGNVKVGTGASGSFSSSTGQLITVADGIIVGIA